MFEIVLASFQIKNKLGRTRFFQKSFLVTENNMAMILNMVFLTVNNADVLFVKQELIQKSYIPAKILSIIKRIKIIDKKEFAEVALDKNFKVVVVYVATQEALLVSIAIHSF